MRTLDERLVSLLRPDSWEAEAYRTLRHIIERRRGASSLVVGVTSAAPGDGKTTTSINLAASLGESGRARVLLVDGDFRRCDLARTLGLGGADAGPGLAGAVVGPEVALSEVTRSDARWPFSLLPAGAPPPRPCDVLDSPRLGALLEEARREFGFVLVDTPPFVPFIDCRVLSRHVDCFVMVVAAHRTPRRLLEEALSAIDPARLLGLVFNGDDAPLWGSSRYYRSAANDAQPARARRPALPKARSA